MWLKLCLLLAVLALSRAAEAGVGNELVTYEKFDYTNQTMGEMGFPEDDYSPSNFYTISVVENQVVVGHSHRERVGTRGRRDSQQDRRSLEFLVHDQRLPQLQGRRGLVRLARQQALLGKRRGH